MNYQWHDLVGNIGVVFILGAYLLLQLGRLDSASVKFSVVNGVGSALILISLFREFNLSAVAIEVFWLAISLMGLVRSLLGRRRQKV